MRSVGLLLLVGCAAQEYVARARPPVAQAAGVTHSEGFFESGGVKLFEQSWRPASDARGVLVVVHGLKDHSTRYADAAVALAQRGIAVHAFDLRGHGSSEGRRVDIERFTQYLDDLDVFLQRVRAAEPGKPLFLFGHSMGGAIVTDYVLQRKPALRGLILSAAALEADVGAFKRGSVKATAALFPRLAVFDLDLDKFSRDPAVVAACKADPLVDQGNGPARTAAELLGAIAYIDEHMEDVTVPLLAMHGSRDEVTPPQGSRDLVARARSADKTLKIYEGLVHDLLHEPEKAMVLADMAAFIEKRE